MTREEAIKTIRRCCPKVGDSQCDFESALRVLIPELVESEDEKILASIADCVGLMGEDSDVFSNHNVTKVCILSWIKKQKEQEHICDSAQYEEGFKTGLEIGLRKQKEQSFTHHETNESLEEAVTHQMEDDGDVDDFVRRGIDDIALKYAELGVRWQKEQKSAEWSKNDTVFLNEITDFFENKTVRLQHDIDMYAHWLKSLPERFNLQLKQGWSEEDEQRIAEIEFAVMQMNTQRVDTKNKCLDWLKSLRPSWKPSEEQMIALQVAAIESKTDFKTLTSLLIDLKKLI